MPKTTITETTIMETSIMAVSTDDAALTLDELARACDVGTDWVIRHVHAGVLGALSDALVDSAAGVQVTHWRFHGGDLQRARRLLHIERGFDADEQLAALVVDMTDEIRRLRARLHALGFD
jgi:chaperone modulatory protein CbpM